MNESIVPVILLVFALPIIAAVWLIRRALDARHQLTEHSRRLDRLEEKIARMKLAAEPPPVQEPVAARVAAVPPPMPISKPVVRETAPTPAPSPVALPTFVPPPRVPEPIAAPAKLKPAIDWEKFMGVKLFAWLGGVALFLGVAFFVKYSFDNNLVSPQLRATLGFVVGIGLLVAGVVLSRKNYLALSHTLCGTGAVILYAVTFACHAYYHFAFFGTVRSFLLMALITAVAFYLAIRLNALVVAVLGMLGGFLAPVLLSTGQDNPLALFGYILILDAGLVLVALHRRWHFITALGALATVLMQAGWAEKFFEPERYFEGNKIFAAFAVLLVFQVLYLTASGWARRGERANPWLSGGALGLAAVALIFSGWFLTFPGLAARPVLMFGFIFVIDAAVTALVLLDPRMIEAQSVAGVAVFGLMGFWTANSLTNQMLPAALAFYFLFALWHAALPLVLDRRFGLKPALWAGHIFPALALLLMLVPVFKFDETSIIVWPFVLLVDGLAIGFSVLIGSVFSVVAVLLLSLVAIGALIFKIPSDLSGMPFSFFLVAAFSMMFVGVGLWLARRLKSATKTGEDLATQLPVLSAILPFMLLIMAAVRLPLANPTPLFGLALLMVALLMAVTKFLSIDALPAVGLICVAALEFEWHLNRFDPANPAIPLAWYAGFLAVFAAFPFLFFRQFEGKSTVWATAALAGVPQFILVHRAVEAAYPNDVMGLLPAAFAIPPLASLAILQRKLAVDNPARLNQLAWFGGVALLFITLIFPVQFHRQWITIGWALEGASLLWLFHRVPHPGLRLTGAGLLGAAFVRLAVNPAMLEYHPRSATPIFNWYLYAYGIVTVCLFAAARLTAPPRNLIGKTNVPPIFIGLGTVLAFLLLNIEIADYFSPPGATLTFDFNANFGRDMTFSIAWAVFALVLLVAGIVKKMAPPRYAAVGLLSVTLLKLFFHDLGQLGQLYRIGAFIGVAVIAMLASFAYQRFFTLTEPAKAGKTD
jgi:uncharacterized membrane protein